MAKFFYLTVIFSITLSACGGAPSGLAKAENALVKKDYVSAKAGYEKLLEQSLLGFDKKTFYTYRAIQADFNLKNFKPEHFEKIKKEDDNPSINTLRYFLLAAWQIQRKEFKQAMYSLQLAPERAEMLSLINSNLSLIEPIEESDQKATYVAFIKQLSQVEPIQEQVLNALALADKRQKPLLLEFGAAWCPDCRKMAQILAQSPLSEYLSENFIHYKIDVGRFDRNLALVYRYNVKAIAKLVVVSKEGKTLSNKVFEPATGGEKGLTPASLQMYLQQVLAGKG